MCINRAGWLQIAFEYMKGIHQNLAELPDLGRFECSPDSGQVCCRGSLADASDGQVGGKRTILRRVAKTGCCSFDPVLERCQSWRSFEPDPDHPRPVGIRERSKPADRERKRRMLGGL